MKRSEFITVDSTGAFKIRNLQFPATEITGVFYQFDDLYNQNEYLQYVDPVTFGKGFGTVFTDAIYTITTATDGTNDQTIQTYPAPPSARIGVEYYCDWPKLGDLTTNSRLQQYSLIITGTATETGTLQFSNLIDGATVDTSISVTAGTSASTLATQLINTDPINFQNLPGNNTSTYRATAVGGTTNVLLTSPTYTPDTASLGLGTVPAGLSVTVIPGQTPYIQTVQTNWFLFQYPYMYYYGALKHAYNGLEDIERYQLVEKEWLKSVQVFQQFTDRAEWAGVLRQSDYNQNVIW